MRAPPVCVGMDVSKAQLDVALRPTEDPWHVSHEELGSPGLVERLQAVQPILIVLEATGGLEIPAAGALAEAVRPPPRPRPAAQAHALRALLTRRRQLVQRLTAARRRLQTAPQPIRADSQAHLAGLARRLARPDAARAAGIRSSPLWRATDAMLQRTPGGGPGLARTLVAELPAWGLVNRQASAALIGGAPLHRDRGTGRGTRAVGGGRAHVRAVLSMSTVAAVRHKATLTAFDERLRAVGNAPKVARTAGRRKLLTILNARLNHQTPWHEHYAHHS